MPNTIPLLPDRRWRPLLAGLLLGGQALAALAAGGHGAEAPAHAEPAAAAKPAAGDGHAVKSKSAAAVPTPAPPPAAEPAAGGEPEAALLRLRQRLADRLGTPTGAPAQPGVVRVVVREGVGATPREVVVPAGSAAAAVVSRAASRARAAAAAPAHGALPDGGAAHGSGEAAHWGYQGEGGPAAWASLKPEFAQCASGTRQSPIDIRDGVKLQLDPVRFDYGPSSFRVVDNGHTVQINIGEGNSIEVMGRRFELLQFHFHRPSEERIDGRQFDMVAHLVHKSFDGKLAVVAVLLDRGSAHPLVQAVWNNLPLEKDSEIVARTHIDLNLLLPADRRYFTYMGSLTTPPCSEGVLWMVMKQPVALSSEQIGVFSRLYPMNARPLQSAAGRLIKESN